PPAAGRLGGDGAAAAQCDGAAEARMPRSVRVPGCAKDPQDPEGAVMTNSKEPPPDGPEPVPSGPDPVPRDPRPSAPSPGSAPPTDPEPGTHPAPEPPD
ncbi:hypothetical protein, partial [Streptomyces sp. ICN441]|uniref:hypothetical protein n=1 Tax=Streptomyces sp. ICN441 TaxID=2558286 RepID=UPI0019D2DA04